MEVLKMNNNDLKMELKAYIKKRNIIISKRNWKKNNKTLVSKQKKRAYTRKVDLKAFLNILLPE